MQFTGKNVCPYLFCRNEESDHTEITEIFEKHFLFEEISIKVSGMDIWSCTVFIYFGFTLDQMKMSS